MQLSGMLGFENHIKDLAQDRQQRAEKDYLLGINALSRAKESDYQDRAALTEASQKLISALQKNRTNPKPYIALAYLLMLIGDRTRSHRYLLAALRLEPQNETARELMDSLQEVQTITLSQVDRLERMDNQLQALETLDYDLLYDNVEQLIKTSLQELMKRPQPTTPSLNSENTVQLKAELSQLQELWKRIEKQVQLVEAEFETGELYRQLKPLEILMRRYLNAISLSETFQGIVTEIEQRKLETRKLIRAYQPGMADFSERLTPLLDGCDAIADKLDALVEKKVEIQELEGYYHELINLVASLQDMLDEDGA